jgi:hypothetical protein
MSSSVSSAVYRTVANISRYEACSGLNAWTGVLLRVRAAQAAGYQPAHQCGNEGRRSVRRVQRERSGTKRPAPTLVLLLLLLLLLLRLPLVPLHTVLQRSKSTLVQLLTHDRGVVHTSNLWQHLSSHVMSV